MPHTFRTIEQFVQLLEEWQQKSQFASEQASFDSYARGYERGLAAAYGGLAQLVRNSNIGVVKLPLFQSDSFTDWWNGPLSPREQSLGGDSFEGWSLCQALHDCWCRGWRP